MNRSASFAFSVSAVLAECGETSTFGSFHLVVVNGSASAVVADVADTVDAQAIVALARERYGHLDVPVNNAAVHGGSGPIAEIAEEAWDRVLAINLRSVFLMSKAALPALAEARGTIINRGSIVGPVIGTPVSLPYGASKAGIVGFTRNLALQAAPLGVRVNCVCPGPVDTELTRSSFAANAGQRRGDADVAMATFAEGILLGRFGTPWRLRESCGSLPPRMPAISPGPPSSSPVG